MRKIVFGTMILIICITTCVAMPLTEFLILDNTDKNIFIENEYVCVHFADDLIKNASKYNIELYMGGTTLKDGSPHALVVYYSNKNITIIEPQTDEIIYDVNNLIIYDTYEIIGWKETPHGNASQIYYNTSYIAI